MATMGLPLACLTTALFGQSLNFKQDMSDCKIVINIVLTTVPVNILFADHGCVYIVSMIDSHWPKDSQFPDTSAAFGYLRQ